MNNNTECLNSLQRLCQMYNAVGIKTSFEDEGASFNDVVYLRNLCSKFDIDLMLKIGGPEAIRDIKDSNSLCVDGIVAPMVESAFGLEKFVKCANKYNNYPKELVINIETIQSIHNFDYIINSNYINNISSVTVGRVDLVSSLSKDRSFVNSQEILDICQKIFLQCRDKNMKCNLGGAISSDSFTFIEYLVNNNLLDKFETRYIIFDAVKTIKEFHSAIHEAQKFEYHYLINKGSAYEKLASEDKDRVNMIQQRLSHG